MRRRNELRGRRIRPEAKARFLHARAQREGGEGLDICAGCDRHCLQRHSDLRFPWQAPATRGSVVLLNVNGPIVIRPCGAAAFERAFLHVR